MDEFILQFLKGKHQNALLAQDLIYERIQKKNLDVMGSLQKLSQSLEQAKVEGKNSTVVKSIYPVQSFQNGMSAVNKGCPKEGQVSVQTRPKGCILLHPRDT